MPGVGIDVRGIVDSELSAALAASAIPTVLVALDGAYLWVNDAACAFFGRTHDELLQLRWQDLTLPEERASDEAAVSDLVSGRVRSVQPRKRYRHAGGGIIWGHLNVACVRDAKDNPRHLVTQMIDITAVVASEAELADSQRRLADILDADVDPRALLDPIRDASGQLVDFDITVANPAGAAYFQRELDELIGQRLSAILPPEAFLRGMAIYGGVLESGEAFMTDRMAVPQGIARPGRFYDLRAVRAGSGVSITWRDATEIVEREEALAESETRYRLLAENASDVVVQTLDGVMTWLSPALVPALGWRPDEWIGHCLDDYTNPEDVGRLQMRRADVGQGHSSLFRLRLLGREGGYHWVEVHAGPNLDDGGRNSGMVASFRVIDEQVEVERQREHLARFDALTGLMNRAQVIDTVRDVIEQTPRTGSQSAILFCDVDRFKDVNDEFGHAVGDTVLRSLGERIRECIRADDFAARIGGDEFLVVLIGLHGEQEALTIAEKIRSAADQPIALNPAGQIRTGLSIGVALAQPGETVDRFIERADTAMYRAKQAGRNLVSS